MRKTYFNLRGNITPRLLNVRYSVYIVHGVSGWQRIWLFMLKRVSSFYRMTSFSTWRLEKNERERKRARQAALKKQHIGPYEPKTTYKRKSDLCSFEYEFVDEQLSIFVIDTRRVTQSTPLWCKLRSSLLSSRLNKFS